MFVKLKLAKNHSDLYLRVNLVRSVERNPEDPMQTVVLVDIGIGGQTGYAVANGQDAAYAAILECLRTGEPVVAEMGENHALPVVMERAPIMKPADMSLRKRS